MLDGLPTTKRYRYAGQLSIILSLFRRDLFYKDVPLFKKQSVVDKVCDLPSIPTRLQESVCLISLLMILRQLLTLEGRT